jgi:hypothetical protein
MLKKRQDTAVYFSARLSDSRWKFYLDKEQYARTQ